MSSPTFFLEPSDHGTHQVVKREPNKRAVIISDEKMPHLAVKAAREQGIEDNIYFGSGVAVAGDRDVYSELEVISELANLAGMKVRHAYDNDFRIIGYTMELVE